MEGIDGVSYNKQKEDPSKWIAFNAANTYMNQIDSVNKRLDDFSVKFKYKTTKTTGMLMYMYSSQYQDSFSLQMSDGFMRLEIRIHNEIEKNRVESLELESFYNQADGKEHTIEI